MEISENIINNIIDKYKLDMIDVFCISGNQIDKRNNALNKIKYYTPTELEFMIINKQSSEMVSELNILNLLKIKVDIDFEYPTTNFYILQDISKKLVIWVSCELNKNLFISFNFNKSNNKIEYKIFKNANEMILFFKNEFNIDNNFYIYKTDSISEYFCKTLYDALNYILYYDNIVGYNSYDKFVLFENNFKEFTSQPGGVPPTSANDLIVVQYGYNNAFTGDLSAGVFNSNNNDNKKLLNDKYFNLYSYTGKNKDNKNASTVYESICGRKMLTPDQIEFDEDFRLVNLTNQSLFKTNLRSIVKECESLVDPEELPKEYLPLISISDKNIAKCKLKDFPKLQIMTDNDGYFLIDMYSGKRSQSVKDINLLDPKNIILENNNLDYKNSEVKYFNAGLGQYVIDNNIKSLKDLENKYEKFMSLLHDDRFISDDKSISLFGKTNEDRYRELKSQFLKSEGDNQEVSTNLVESVEKFDLLNLKNIEKAKNAHISLEDASFKFKGIKQWSLNTGIYIILPCEDINQLNDLYNKFSSMPKILRRMSDWKLLENIGCDNETFYNFQKSIMQSNSVSHSYPIPLIESGTPETDEIINIELPLDLPFYSPYELQNFINNKPLSTECIIDKDKITLWLKEYKKIYNGEKFNRDLLVEWVSLVRKLTFKLYNQCKNDDNNSIKESLLELGWNPYLDFSIKNRVLAYERVKHIKLNEDINEFIKESKDIPVKFDNYGNLLITKPDKVDLDKEYFESHRLLKSYKKFNNLDGIKFELCRLWYLNNIAENKIYTKNLNKKELDAVNKSRARILNDFDEYIKIILKKDKNFNFNNYYSKSKFDDKQLRINRSTLKYSFEYIKQVLKNIL